MAATLKKNKEKTHQALVRLIANQDEVNFRYSFFA